MEELDPDEVVEVPNLYNDVALAALPIPLLITHLYHSLGRHNLIVIV